MIRMALRYSNSSGFTLQALYRYPTSEKSRVTGLIESLDAGKSPSLLHKTGFRLDRVIDTGSNSYLLESPVI